MVSLDPLDSLRPRKECDIAISTAAIPGRPSPLLITKDMADQGFPLQSGVVGLFLQGHPILWKQPCIQSGSYCPPVLAPNSESLCTHSQTILHFTPPLKQGPIRQMQGPRLGCKMQGWGAKNLHIQSI